MVPSSPELAAASSAEEVVRAATRGEGLRVVLWGASRSGRTTVLHHLAAAAMRRGPVTCAGIEAPTVSVAWCELRTRAGRVARVLGLEGEPGEGAESALLEGADVVLFVADSHKRRLGANRGSAVALLRKLPSPRVVLCVHKRDLPLALGLEVVTRELAPLGAVEVAESVGPDGRRAEALLDAVLRALESASARAIAG